MNNTDKDYGMDNITDPQAIIIGRKIIEVLEEDLGKDFYISSVNAPLLDEDDCPSGAILKILHEEGSHKYHFDMDACYGQGSYKPFEKMIKALGGTGFYIEAYSTYLSHVYRV